MVDKKLKIIYLLDTKIYSIILNKLYKNNINFHVNIKKYKKDNNINYVKKRIKFVTVKYLEIKIYELKLKYINVDKSNIKSLY